jgi:hypothetical protein
MAPTKSAVFLGGSFVAPPSLAPNTSPPVRCSQHRVGDDTLPTSRARVNARARADLAQLVTIAGAPGMMWSVAEGGWAAGAVRAVVVEAVGLRCSPGSADRRRSASK